jgi:alpha-galactosidase
MISHMRWIATEAPRLSCSAANLTVDLLGDTSPFTAQLTAREAAPGIVEVDLELTAAAPAVPPEAPLLRWSLPAHDLHCCWRPDKLGSVAVPPDWSRDSLLAKATVNAPLLCLHSTGGRNRMTAAWDDALHATRLWAGLREEDGRVFCTAQPVAVRRAPVQRLAMRLRIDRRDLAWHEAIGAVRSWWAAQPGYAPAPVPAAGWEPMYSTWYSLHQDCPPARVEAQCALAAPLGCAAVIVDDGWQTLDGNRGYGFTGDWEPERMGDMRAHVDRVHALGLKYLLWFSVPFVGFHARCFAHFESMLLKRDERMQAGILDPRFPAVREHLAALYERCVRDWDLDGLKLDFVDVWWEADGAATGGRDIADLDEAVDALMKEILRRVRAVKPDILIEFRQGYYGPLMRTYGNLIRAADCPGDILANRARTLDVRLLCDGSAAHADMLMWHADEPVEAAALQLLAVLFAVPQISADLTRLRPDHGEMLRFWTAWWREHRRTLVQGRLAPQHPELQYPVVEAQGDGETILAVYADAAVARLAGAAPARLHLVNAARCDRLLLELDQPLGRRRLTVRDCRGRIVDERTVELAAGVHRLAVPASGLATLEV